MISYFPSYYNSFNCIADKCEDTCCAKWEIVIDDKTAEKYEKLENKTGDRIRSFLLTDADGDICFQLQNGKCPFLNENGLCNIHIELGIQFTSEICRTHPRFVEEYDGFTEVSLSLSCPEANRIIMNTPVRADTYPTPDYNGEDEVLQQLVISRRNILEYADDFNKLTEALLNTAADDQLDIDLVYIENTDILTLSLIKEYCEYILRNTEILTDEWKSLLKNTIDSEVNDADFLQYIKKNNVLLSRVCSYYIYRYYLKAVNDLDIFSRALFILLNTLLGALISFTDDISLSEAARLCSKEIEHNTLNINKLLEFLSEI
ncbi:MAG: flagellin lysine-N-methylase [Clostridia bacterium]|nr:flagellin lysine-N-methylase [Clostridia bacterium]